MPATKMRRSATVRGFNELLKPIAALIAAADSPRLMCAAVNTEILRQVNAINGAAQIYIQSCLTKTASKYSQPFQSLGRCDYSRRQEVVDSAEHRCPRCTEQLSTKDARCDLCKYLTDEDGDADIVWDFGGEG